MELGDLSEGWSSDIISIDQEFSAAAFENIFFQTILKRKCIAQQEVN